MKKGEIYLVEFPIGVRHEQEGTRPALIISHPIANICIIIPFTSNIQALRFPFTLSIKPNKINGLASESIALIFQIRAIDKTRIKNKLGDLETHYLDKINQSLKELLRM